MQRAVVVTWLPRRPQARQHLSPLLSRVSVCLSLSLLLLLLLFSFSLSPSLYISNIYRATIAHVCAHTHKVVVVRFGLYLRLALEGFGTVGDHGCLSVVESSALPRTTLGRQPKHTTITHDNKQSIALKVRPGSAYIFLIYSIYQVQLGQRLLIGSQTLGLLPCAAVAIRSRRRANGLLGFPIDLLACPTGSPTAGEGD